MTLVATLIANPAIRNLSPELAQMASKTIGSSPPHWLADRLACDFPLPADVEKENAIARISAVLEGHCIDLVIQENATRRKTALIADMDSTMIDQECIDELATETGLRECVAAITAKAMNGEIEFELAIDQRVALLEGLPAAITDKIITDRITLAAGGKTLVATMRANKSHTALVSSGFTCFTSPIAAMLGFHENRANILETKAGKLTGKVRKPVLGAAAKVEAMREIAEQKRLQLSDFIAVGDGANDLPMLKLAGTGVALHAKPNVAAQASVCIKHSDLTALLYLQGYHEDMFIHE